MNQVEFQKLIEIEEEEDMNKLELGDFFLYGRYVIAQKQGKAPGQEVSYYQVVGKDDITGSIEYTPVFDCLDSNEE